MGQAKWRSQGLIGLCARCKNQIYYFIRPELRPNSMKLLNELELLSINQHYSSRTHCSHMLNPFKVLSHRQLNFMNVIANPLNRSPRDTQFCISSLLLFCHSIWIRRPCPRLLVHVSFRNIRKRYRQCRRHRQTTHAYNFS